MRKVILAAELIEKRILFADHVVAGMPSERQLANELGLSRTTVRKAVQQLMDKGTLERQENGRLQVSEQSGQRRTRTIGFITPEGASTNRDEWRESLNRIVRDMGEEQGFVLRSVVYAHWADSAIQEALASFDGAFFMTETETIPNWLMKKINEFPCRVMSLNRDYSHAGLPSIQLFTPSAERQLFDHLYRLGHRRIDCLNTQALDGVIQSRIAVWREYNELKELKGQLHSLTLNKPVELAYQLVRDILQEGRPLGTALFCTTGPAAIGAMRAAHEAGLKVGDDISVCAVNSEGLGRYLQPTLTALEAPPRAPYLRRALQWMMSDEAWQGPLLIEADDVPLFEGESTGPAPLDSINTSPLLWNSTSAQSTTGKPIVTSV